MLGWGGDLAGGQQAWGGACCGAPAQGGGGCRHIAHLHHRQTMSLNMLENNNGNTSDCNAFLPIMSWAK